jgi:acyl-CoA synthetase (AMP-forming)/AMP-acid ligase II
MVPPMITNLLNDIKERTSIRQIINTSATLDASVSHRCEQQLNASVKQGTQTITILLSTRSIPVYVSTKLGGICSWPPDGPLATSKVTSIGTPLPGMLVRVVHAYMVREQCVESTQSLQPLPIYWTMYSRVNERGDVRLAGERGELCVRGPQCTPQIYKNVKSTNELYDNEQYLRTGLVDANHTSEITFAAQVIWPTMTTTVIFTLSTD